jgi:hypothetical protein
VVFQGLEGAFADRVVIADTRSPASQRAPIARTIENRQEFFLDIQAVIGDTQLLVQLGHLALELDDLTLLVRYLGDRTGTGLA